MEGTIIWRLKNEIFRDNWGLLTVLAVVCWAYVGHADVCVCLSWTSFAVWRGNFGWRCTDVRCHECVRHRLGEHCWECWTFALFHFTGLNLWSCKSQPLSAQQLRAIPGAAGCVTPFCYGTLLRALPAFSGALNELRNYKKLPEVCLTFRCTACSLPDTTESTVIAWPEACML